MPDKPAGQPRRTRGRISIRRATLDDVPAIYACQQAAYPTFPPHGLCDERQLGMQIARFPEGQLVAVADDRVVGYCTTLIVALAEDSPWYSYNEITGYGTFSTHDPSGDTLYGADIAVHPEYQGRGIAGRLYKARKRLLTRFNLRCMVAGGRIPGYRQVAGRMTAEEYVERVVRGELKDRALNAHLKAGYRVVGVHMGYLRDEASLDYATFLEMPNPSFDPERRRIAATPIRRPARKVRVCAAQYEMRPVHSWAEFKKQVGFFVAAANDYHSHFLLFPELFTVQLFTTMPSKLSGPEAIERLADLTDRYIELFREQAKSSGLHIIGGTHPVRSEDGIRNVAHLFTPSGNVYTQDKLHVTPTERQEYGIRPGDGIRIFDTGLARIAIVVCYDIEFPELVRLVTLAGAEVIFCPFSTDEHKGYLRVRYTAHARAVENMLYVVLAGNVGNLPEVENFLINYGQAAVLTPSDVAFPSRGIAGEADPNTETIVVCDLDLSSLELQRELGTVRVLRDRREDLYEVKSRNPVEIIRTS